MKKTIISILVLIIAIPSFSQLIAGVAPAGDTIWNSSFYVSAEKIPYNYAIDSIDIDSDGKYDFLFYIQVGNISVDLGPFVCLLILNNNFKIAIDTSGNSKWTNYFDLNDTLKMKGPKRWSSDSINYIFATGMGGTIPPNYYNGFHNKYFWFKNINTNKEGWLRISGVDSPLKDSMYVSIDQYLLASSNSLPTKLQSFNVQGSKTENTISWQTATEINTSHFNIQRSNNGKDFTTIGKVDAKGASTYTFNDQSHPPTPPSPKGVLYYRLEVVDKDGSKTYSEIRSVSLTTDDSGFTISPNPAKDYVTITGSNIKQVKLLDNMGRVVIVKEVNNTPINIPVSNLSKGLYMVQATYIDGSMKTEKVVVE